jgi:PPP family 3-phenylpropionic acid transporter
MYWSLAFIGTFAVYGILSPYISVLIRGMGFSHSIVGMLLAVCEGAAIASPFVTGAIADRLGRYRPVVLLCVSLTFAGAFTIFVSKNLVLCALALPVLTFAYRSIQPLIEAVSTINLGKTGNFGKYRTVGSLIFFILVIFFQITPFRRPNVPENVAFWVCFTSIFSMICFLIIPSSYYLNKKTAETAPLHRTLSTQISRKPIKTDKIIVQHSSFRKIWSPFFILGFLIIVLNRFGMSPIQGFLSLYVLEGLNWDAVGLIWALSTGSEMPFIFLSKRLIARFGALPLMAFSTGAVFVRLLICAFFPSKTGVIIAQCLHSLAYGILHPSAVAFISQCVPPAQRAIGMSLYLSLGTGVPTLIGNFAGGFIVENLGYRWLFASFSIFPLTGVILYLASRKRSNCIADQSIEDC